MGERATPYPPASVVIATRDRPELLERAVRHVLEQDYPGDVQCVVVYDHVAVRPLDVPVPAGRTLRLIANDHRQGLPGGRNSGVTSTDCALREPSAADRRPAAHESDLCHSPAYGLRVRRG